MCNQKHVSVITGAGGGIGFGIAHALAKRGDQVIMVDLLFSNAERRAKTMAAMDERVCLMDVDITKEKDVHELVDEIVKRFGRVDCLVNAAGVIRPAVAYEVTEADWDLTLNVNLKGAFLLSKWASVQMMKQKYGRIVHIGSTSSHTSSPCSAPYTASKHGIVGLVRAFAIDLAPHGITVNTICPGITETEMLEVVIRQRAAHQGISCDQVRRDMINKTPDKRLGQPSDIAAAVLFITSTEAEHITGQMLTVDGGRSLNLI